MNKELTDIINKISSDRPVSSETRAPDGYFEKLPDQVLKRWKEEKRKSTGFLIQLQKMIAAAVIVFGICITVALLTNHGHMNTADIEISSTEAYDYIFNHIEAFDSLLEEPLSLAELHETQDSAPGAIEDFLLQELDGSDIEQFF
jgi:hypothetical protein